MAYAITNPPQCLVPRVGTSGPAIWTYNSVDAKAVVNGAGYITNALELGMAVGDLVVSVDNDTASPTTLHYVASFSGSAATLGFCAVA